MSESAGRAGAGRLGLLVAAAVILLGGAIVLYDAVRIASSTGFGPQQSGFFPVIVGVGLVIFGLLFLARTTIWPDRLLFEHAALEHTESGWLRLWGAVVGLVIYAVLLDPMGYIITTALFFVGIARIVGSRRLVRDVIVGVAFAVAAYFAFTEFLGVRLPAGLLEPLL